METITTPRVAGEYRELAEQLRCAGLFRRRSGNFALRIVLTIGGFAAGWGALFLVGSSWLALVVGAFLAGASTHVLFLGHDAGHQQIFRSRRANHVVGLIVGDLLTGLSFGWWLPKHNAHHRYPNQIGGDPDIGPGAASSSASGEAVRAPKRSSLAAYMKAVTLLPRLLLEIGMHLSSGRALARRRDRAAVTEWLLLAGHVALYLTAVFWLLPLLHAIAFIAIQQALFGFYLRVSFAPNHKGMPIIEADRHLDFIERQVLTSRDVNGGWLLTFLLGGLNYQIEHHLFPSMPRPNLPRAQPIVRTFCAEHHLPYREDNVIASYREAIASLRPSRLV